MTDSTPSAAPLAVVVGCGGIGMACARMLGRDHRLVLIDIDRDVLHRSTALLVDEGHSACGIVCDIGDEASVAAMGQELLQYGSITTLAHVAGLAPSCGNWRSIMRVNAVGAARVAEILGPQIVAPGAAVFISSLGGHLFVAPKGIDALLNDPLQTDFLDSLACAAQEPITSSIAYGWSKIALMRMCQRLSAPWGRDGTRINSISPGLISSPMGVREFASEPRKYAMLERTPLGRQGSMLEVAELVSFLCSSRASFITGTDILIDGGLAAGLRQKSAF